ncbi:MAG: phosphoadenylyl-sulfate reductase [Bacteroidota bacterium]
MLATEIDQLNQQFATGTPAQILKACTVRFPGKLLLSTSMGAEDQMLTHLIGSEKMPIEIVTLDTGRLFADTYSLMERTRERYGISIRILFPDAAQVEAMVNLKGINLFYESVDNRKLCCHIRKIEPLKKALNGKHCWITGLRAEQSEYRADMQLFEWDLEFEILKVNPLLQLTEIDVWAFIRAMHVPYNKLHDKNYKSIGCQPCTRAVAEGENARAGRWWWEDANHKECGLHER